MTINNAKKVVVVTGSNRGIGYAIVKRLCKEFDGIIYLTARNIENGQKAVASLNSMNLYPEFHQLDIEDINSINKFADHLREKHGGVDVIYNNAAIFIHKEDNIPIEKELESCYRLNYHGTINFCNALFPLLRSNGRVINVSSRLALLGIVKNKKLKSKLSSESLTLNDLNNIMIDYKKSFESNRVKQDGYPETPFLMTKVALNALTEIYQREFDLDLSRNNIIVCSVCPGYCKTDATRGGGILTADTGVETAAWLASFSNNNQKGAFWAEKKLINWKTTPFICATFSMLKKAIISKFS